MRATFTILMILGWIVSAWAQPANDDCINATNLTLSVPTPCPSTTPAISFFSYDNFDATPTTPYPQFSGCNPGGATSGPAAEVWFTFTATSNSTDIMIDGLNNPQVAIFTGNACDFLTPIACGSSPNVLNMTVNTLAGTTYYMLVSGEDVDDQGVFNMQFDSYNNCNPCLLSNNFSILPPPINGTYSSGSTVSFCFTIEQWDVTGTIEWLHSITLELGSGWDQFSLTPTQIPPSCGGDGSWGFYDSWTGCNTGQTFGPGFAYDSSSGVGCGGSPNDGDPGNNWGDGNGGCSTITPANPVTFCWSVQVSDCPPNSNGADLSMIVNIWSDGDSGSWTQTGCNSGFTFDFLASAVCCNDSDPIAIEFPTSCPGAANGSIQVTGGEFPISGDAYNFYLFNLGGALIDEALGVIGPHTFENLPAGIYSIQAVNSLSGCSRSVTVTIVDGPPPQAIASQLPACLGQPISLSGDVIPGDPGATYEWTGPDGTLFGQNVTVNTPGAWTLVVTTAGCPADPVTINVTAEEINVTATADPMTVCENQQPVTLTAQGDPSLVYDWGPYGMGQTIVVPPLATTTTFTVTATNPATGCFAQADITVNVQPLPLVQILDPGPVCLGQVVVLEAIGAQTYNWEDGQTGPIATFVFDQLGNTTVTVVGQDAFGCVANFTLNVFVVAPPEGEIIPGDVSICSGDQVTLTASGGIDYLWSTGDGGSSITVSPVNTFPYTVTITDANGCTDEVTATVTVDIPVIPPTVTCQNATPTSVEFTWDPVAGAGAYDVNVLTGQTGVLSGTTFFVDMLAPGEDVTIEVTAVSGNSCPDQTTTVTCSAQDCPTVNISIDNAPAVVCLGDPTTVFDLEATLNGNMGGGTLQWSGPGITDTDEGVFDASDAGVGAHTITASYSEGLCTYEEMVTIEVFETPTADFIISDTEFCSTDFLTVTYNGNASAAADYDWSFDGGSIISGTDAGPYVLEFDDAGTYTISLVVEENGCESEVFSREITVEEPLPAPTIICEMTSTTEVTFSWTDIPGASSYTVNVQSGQTGGALNGTTYTIGGLMPGESVTIEVIAENNGPCGSSSNTQTCTADDCPNVDITLDTPQNDICLDGTTMPFDLTADIVGGAGNGTMEWSGTGITDAMNGTFDPTVAMEGTHTITFTYTEPGPCEYTATIDINVFDIPTASFDVNPDSICVDGGSTTVEYTGDADPANATFNWTFNGGTANPTTGPGPITVSWANAGTRTITLTVVENGCSSETVSQTVEVEAPLEDPVITCGTATTTSVEFDWMDVAGASGYTVNILSGQSGGMLNGTNFALSGLMPGESVTIQVIAEGDGACGNSMAEFTCTAADCPTFVVDIDIPQNNICLDGMNMPFDLSATVNGGTGGGTFDWSGTGITDAANGTFDPTIAMEGSHDITLVYEEGPCSVTEVVTINVFDTPTADFTVMPDTVCINEEVTVEYAGDADPANATFSWNFSGGVASSTMGPGPITVSWPTGGTNTISLTVTENGCTSEAFTQDVTVEEPLAAPVINCMSTTSTITFSWNDVTGATGYNVQVLNGNTGTLNGTTYEVTGLMPGDVVEIEVEAIGEGPCGSSFAILQCIAEDCPMITIDLPEVDSICLDATAMQVDLDATLTGDNGMGTETWAGPGIIDAANGIFDPTVAMVGNHVITYTYQEGNCTYNNSLNIVVNPQPTADFTVESPICVDGSSTISFTGSAGAGATYDWDFDDGTGMPGTGAGPHEVNFPTGGTKTINLVVTQNGCASEVFTQTIEVEEPLPAPNITCNSTNTSITFSWDDIPGATGFDVVQIFGDAGTINGNTYEVTGLEPGDSVRIRVIALDDGPCGNVPAELTCYAQDCPDVDVTIDPVGPLCDNDGILMLTASASMGMGTFTWSGTGIIDPMMGTFDPSMVNGTVTINVAYTDGACTYNSSIQIIVNEQPTADFTVVSPVCIDQNSNIVYTGTASPGATYDWNFDGGMAMPGTGAGPHNVSWTTGGTKTITLTVTENACVSEEFTQTVEVEEPLADPVIMCDTDNTSITFSWDDVPGAMGYDIVQVFGETGVINGNSYEITGLEPGDSARIRVIALNDGPCGNSQSVLTCYAQNCPDVTVTIDPVSDLCQDDGIQTLTAIASMGTGTFSWSGPGIVDANAGTFDPAAFDGTETITVTYTDGICTYTATVDITVFEVPTATFEIEDMIVCIGDVTEIDYTGTAGSMATYDWNFDGGIADPGGTVAGPHDISWDTPGTKTISLQVTEDGCTSETFTLMVEVEEPLAAPIVDCDSDNTSITFSWNDVPGAEGYEVNVLTGQMGTLNGTTFLIENMTPGESATIEVVALDSGPCGNITTEITCIAADCPDRTVEITDPGALCADAGVQTLMATIDGMPGTGTYTWAGPGIVDGDLGTFNPALVAGNTVTVSVTYTEGVCTYSATIQITVNTVPIAAFTANGPICVDASTTVTFTGTAGAGATYDWEFDGGMGGAGAGPFDVSWTEPGLKTITLTVTENGCVSETVTQQVQVDPVLEDPVIDCSTTINSIVFSWDAIDGADAYDVVVETGQNGTLTGTTFTVENLEPGEEVTITVTAIGTSVCGNSMASATCVAQDCPDLNVTMDLTASICLGVSDNPELIFTFDGASAGPFRVDYLNETTNIQNSVVVQSGEAIDLSDVTETTTITLISYADTSLPECEYNGNQSLTITVSEPVNAGTADQPSSLCEGTAETIDLFDLVIGGDAGGVWSETSATPSTGGAFNATNGTLNTGNLDPGTYTFEYLLTANAPCDNESVEVSVVVYGEPVADAGETQELTCNMGMVNIGGMNTSSGAGITYQWTAEDPGNIIANPSIAFPEISQPGTYTLVVTNEFGCTATDQVTVTANFDVPVAEIAISEISCFEANDGAITIDNVTGGAGGYQFSLNGGPFTTTPQFGSLGPNEYSLIIEDQNGCFSELMVNLTQPEEIVITLTTDLGPDNTIELGDSVRLEAIFDPSINVDTLIWQPDSIAKGNSPVVFVNPQTATNYSVTIIDENGCSDTDDMMVFVRKVRPVFIPNVFSPNEDGFNDIFYIQGGDFIREVKTFSVFNRWGESVLELTNFQPNDPSFGWDGTFRGEPVNPAVYVWFAEIEFDDGEVILYKGDVAVMK